MSNNLIARLAFCSLKSNISRSACIFNSRSTDRVCIIEPNCHSFTNKSCYSTQFKREWKRLDKPSNSSKATFTLMSYNILAQQYIDTLPSLYYNHNPDSLGWSHRFDALKHEIAEISPDILCLQEVQQSHLTEIATHFNDLGYDTSMFKKRTGEQVDGCAIFYKKNIFDLVESHFVDYFQPDIKVCEEIGQYLREWREKMKKKFFHFRF